MKLPILCCLPLVLAACAQPLPESLLAPADPAQGVTNTGPRSVTHDARAYKIEEPLAWDELNRRVTPKEPSR